MAPVKVLLVDDSREFIDSIEAFLNSIPNVRVVGVALNGREAIRKVAELDPDLILMDIVMPEMNGLRTAGQIKSKDPAPRIVMLTLHNNEEYRLAAEEAGADEFVSKSEFGDRFLPLLHRLFPSSSS